MSPGDERIPTELGRKGWMSGCGRFGIVSYPGGYKSESDRKGDYPDEGSKNDNTKSRTRSVLRGEGREPSPGESLEIRSIKYLINCSVSLDGECPPGKLSTERFRTSTRTIALLKGRYLECRQVTVEYRVNWKVGGRCVVVGSLESLVTLGAAG
ncbi:hypothetical protein CDAR_452901 [Caerostris darwini]|uniref:Uncharacterized protein n=1 Tax=Caerostris darwini TaxID=1538125 RepID=A0AAV4RGE5_9ARAC|nr:hypothetical protein CDAR_452901 [Caerostris darwini]